ncbi:MAG: hypothetical protein ABR956_18280 [Terracidiphilus sp.]|jgi:hypothetical protein
MLLELGKAVSFLLSILSLYPVLMSAFFVPGSGWRERLAMALLWVAFSASVCFASGLLFSWPSRANQDARQALLATLPVRLFLLTLAGMIVLFALSWYIEEYFVPFMRHDCCRP